jgi:hypothetical protein
MDLNDFRRQWQQQPSGPTDPSLTHQKLQAMLATQPASPVSEMLHNAKRDQRLILIVVLLNVGNITNLTRRHLEGSTLVVLDVVVALMILFVSWHAYRQRQLLRQLQLGNGTTYEHLRKSIRQLRALIRNKAYVAMAFLTTIILTVAYGKHEAIWAGVRAGRVDWLQALVVGLTTLGLMAGLLYFSRARQQRRYGRYLDQLEGALRELEETH